MPYTYSDVLYISFIYTWTWLYSCLHQYSWCSNLLNGDAINLCLLNVNVLYSEDRINKFFLFDNWLFCALWGHWSVLSGFVSEIYLCLFFACLCLAHWCRLFFTCRMKLHNFSILPPIQELGVQQWAHECVISYTESFQSSSFWKREYMIDQTLADIIARRDEPWHLWSKPSLIVTPISLSLGW